MVADHFRYWLLTSAIAATLICGCGEQEPPLFQVRGTVVYKGQPIRDAELVLHPLFDGPRWMPIAVTGDDGAFVVSTKSSGDGALAGRYKVTVTCRPIVDDVEGPNLLPARYSSPETSPIEIEVGPSSATLSPFELTD